MRKSDMQLNDDECRTALTIVMDVVVEGNTTKDVPKMYRSRAEMVGYKVLQELNTIGLIEPDPQAKQMEMRVQ